MGKRLIALFLLILHLNSSMLIPRVTETDVYENGLQVDDINSTVEYVQQQLLEMPDDSPEDEDDDNAQNLHSTTPGIEICDLNLYQTDFTKFLRTRLHRLIPTYDEKLLSGNFDIPIPPPKHI